MPASDSTEAWVLERYQLDWPGKRQAVAAASTPATATLRPQPAESVEFDTTANLFIEGDNLDALKLLRASHLGSVAMIYVDPPYNTGNDFTYSDDFASHADWLSLMYPRLAIARDLLSDNGLLFISIDDHELSSLVTICREIFGEANHVNTFVWVSNLKGRQIGRAGAVGTKEYVVCFARQADRLGEFRASAAMLKALMPSVYRGFNYPVQRDERGPYVVKNELHNTNSRFNEATRPNLVYDIYYDPQAGEVRTAPVAPEHVHAGFVKIAPKRNNNGMHRYHAFRWSRSKVEAESHDLAFVESPAGWKVYTKVRDVDLTSVKDLLMDISTSDGSRDLVALGLPPSCFDYPKPLELMMLLCEIGTTRDSLVLDFFGGSATTAHAVMRLNAQDGGRRRFIQVQLPVPLKPGSAAGSGGCSTIAGLARERLRRAGAAIRQAAGPRGPDLDIGFRAFRLEPTGVAAATDGTDPTLRTHELVDPATLTGSMPARAAGSDPASAPNRLIHGDNLRVMAALLAGDETAGPLRGGVDLIYVDPPFGSAADYRTQVTLPGASPDSPRTIIEQAAYCDTWADGPASYLDMLTPRLAMMRELLSDTGSICVHLDWHVSHYVKVVLDDLFGRDNLINEVIWRYGKMSNATRRFPQNHDVILIYAKTRRYYFQSVRTADSEYKTRFDRYVVDNRVTYGAVKDSRDKLVVGRIRKVQADRGRDLRDADVLFDFNRERKAQDDVFYDISIVKGNAAENLPFDTQKPVKLVARLIDALCPPDGVVADLFAGSGTTAAAAEAAGRRWVVADAGPSAVMMTRRRLVAAVATPFVRQRIAAADQRLGRLAASARSDGAAAVVTLTGCDVAVGDVTGLDARGLEAVTALAARDPLALLDGWAVDAAYDGAMFRPQWQTYRGMGDSDPLRVVTTARLDLRPGGGSPQGVCVRAIDVFGRELEVVVPLRA